jgi:hypothetical protein
MRHQFSNYFKNKRINFNKYCTQKHKNVTCIKNKNSVVIKANLIIYGGAATLKLAQQMAYNVQWHWNYPKATILISGKKYKVKFLINGFHFSNISPSIILKNRHQQHVFIRIEHEISTGISVMDKVNSNSGFFKLQNVGYVGASTEAHEYGHALGLWPSPDGHPQDLDQRGKGVPGIMYPRGTWVDPQYQYVATTPAGEQGGTVHPDKRRVRQLDIEMLFVNFDFPKGKALQKMGSLTNIYHKSVL